MNQRTKINSFEDIESLANEFVDFPYEDILNIHIVGDNSSGITVKQVLGIEFYIDLIDKQILNN